MTHQHIYVVGDDQCRVCRERRDPIDVKLETLQAMAVKALGYGQALDPDGEPDDTLRQMSAQVMEFARSLQQEIDDEAADRLHHAEWDADRGA